MTRIWEEVVEEGIVTEKSSRATELIIVLIILAIIAFAVGFMYEVAFLWGEGRNSLRNEPVARREAKYERQACTPSSPQISFSPPFSEADLADSNPSGAGIHKRRPALTFTITAYCPKSCCCGEFADGITASGHIIEPGDRFVAAPPEYPFGTLFSIEGYAGGEFVEVRDRGGKIKGNRLDVFFPDHNEALAWGVQEMRIEQ